MGIVITQSIKNIASTYAGFVIGAINTLFLYTEFLTDAYYGMVGYMMSLAYVVMPLMAFGVHNTLIKFYSSLKSKNSVNSFLTLMVLLPLLTIIPLVFATFFGHNIIARFLSKQNPIISGYLWHTILIATSLAYFEVFFALAKVQMKTVFGNFMKEVFHRAMTMLLLFLLYFQVIDAERFMIGLVIIYILRMLVMMFYVFSVKTPVILFKRVDHIKRILQYSFLMVIAGSIATSLLDIDKVMLGNYVSIEEIAYYNVAIFIAAVIAVPQRSMHQILMPLSAKFLNERKLDALEDLYKRSSVNLFISGGFIFLLIILNINELYYMIPQEFRKGLFVVLIISIVKLYDSLLGSNNAILFNSDYYRIVLILGAMLVVLMITLNIIFIPLYGINGAGLATFVAVFIYNSIKLFFVYKKFKIVPFTVTTFKVGCFIFLCALLFYFWDFPFNPLINIGLKSTLLSIVYLSIVYVFNFSEDITALINKTIKRNR